MNETAFSHDSIKVLLEIQYQVHETILSIGEHQLHEEQH